MDDLGQLTYLSTIVPRPLQTRKEKGGSQSLTGG